ncbi:MAG TPA: DUF502 domain-containing protein [Methylophilaceae bacterium]|jgi:uncharacterized membrane protein
MKHIYQYFFRGLLAALPLGLTVYLLYLFLSWSEGIAMWWVRPLIGEFYIPGMGLAMGIAGIVLLGFIISHERALRLLSWLEVPFTNLPVVKSVYSSLKNFAEYFAPNKNNPTQQVVIVRIPGQQIEMVGLITRQSLAGLPEGFLPGDRVAVYLPMGYMIGGYTIFVPREWLQPIDMSVEEAMRYSLFAWMANIEEKSDDNRKLSG